MRKKMTATDYAKKRHITKQAVSDALRKRERGETYYLPGVLKIDKFSRFYLLTVQLTEKGEVDKSVEAV